MARCLSLFFLFFFVALVQAQSPVVAPRQTQAVLIVGATAHLGNGMVIANSAIAFENGKLTLVADATTIRLDRTRFGKIFDASGKHVYPGFIAAHSRLGLVEIDAVRATQDFSEVGSFNPNARAVVAYNADSELIPTVRSNGVLMSQVSPSGGTVSGTSSLVQHDAWNWEDAILLAEEGLFLNWPAVRSWGGWETGNPQQQRNEQYDKNVAEIKNFFAEAQAYSKQPKPAVANPRFESMRPLFEKKQTLYIRASQAKPMQEAVLMAETLGLSPVLVGASDAWLITDFLVEHKVPVILSETQRLPSREDEAVDQPYRTPGILHEKGVLFCISEDGSWRLRNLPFQAGQAVGYGLPYEDAVSAITLNAAKILGVDNVVGSLAVGKDATLFISEGDALDMRTCIVTAAFIQGREIDLDNKQKTLYRTYEARYKQ
ncbi:MAG: amidohydrolase family protein [Saprospiraceae bacterium]|nr:amidohydrolase family protein [Saprospiraceae bacterium]